MTIKYVYRLDPIACAFNDLSIFMQTGLVMYNITLIGRFIDSTGVVLEEFESLDLMTYIQTQSFQDLVYIIIVWILIKLIDNLQDYFEARISRLVGHNNYMMILNKLSEQNLQEIETTKFHELLTFVRMYSIGNIYTVYALLGESLRTVLSSISAIVILYSVVGWYALLLILFSLFEPITKYFGDRSIRLYRRVQIDGIKMFSYLFFDLAIQIPFFSELRVNDIFTYIKRKYNKDSLVFQKGLISRFAKYYANSLVSGIIGKVLQFGFSIYILFVAVGSGLTIGRFSALFNYSNSAYQSTNDSLTNIFQLLDRLSYVDEFFEFRNYQGFGANKKYGNQKIPKGVPEIRFDDLSFKYASRKGQVLRGVNLNIPAGSKVAFIGGDGSGKSSLVKTLCGLYEIKNGDYKIADISVKDLARKELKSRVSVMFQDFVRYNLNVKKNIIISSGKQRAKLDRYEEVKKVAGVKDFMKSEDIDDDQMLGKYFKGGRELAPGHWQRLAIARTLYRNRDVYILDEPFTYIDSVSKSEILDKTFKFLKDKTLIYVSKSTSSLQGFDNIFYIYKGELVESGSYDELMKAKGQFYKDVSSSV